MLKKLLATALTTFFASSSIALAAPPVERETINQVALLQSLTLGYFDGSISVKD